MAPVARPGRGSGPGIAGGAITPITNTVACMADLGLQSGDRPHWLGAQLYLAPTLNAHYAHYPSMDGDAGLRCRAGGCTLLLRGIGSESGAGQLFTASVHVWSHHVLLHSPCDSEPGQHTQVAIVLAGGRPG